MAKAKPARPRVNARSARTAHAAELLALVATSSQTSVKLLRSIEETLRALLVVLSATPDQDKPDTPSSLCRGEIQNVPEVTP